MLVFDLESNGLDNYTKIHTITIYDTELKTYDTYDELEVPTGLKRLAGASSICGHNILCFDLPCIRKLYPWFDFKGKAYDTLVWSRLVYPDIKEVDILNFKKWQMPSNLIGKHSLESWGYRLGVYKGDFGKTSDWSEWSQEMSDYCRQDVVVTVKLLEKLQSKETSEESLELEHQVALIIQRQIEHGFLFDISKAEQLYVKLLKRKEEIEGELVKVFPPFIDKEVFIPKVNNKTRGYVKGEPFTKVIETPFNPGSRQHIERALKELYDWKPKEFTPSGQAKVNEDVLRVLSYPEAKLLAEYFMIQKRLGQLADGDKGWMRLVKSDGRIHGDVITNGTPTARATHNNPNVSQVPAVRLPYGKECRELWTVPEGYLLVDADASQLELRCLAHYLAKWDSGEYAKQVLEGDIHTVNQKAAGLETRDQAKTFIYALIYGAGNWKIGSIVGKGAKEGKQLKDRFMKRLPAYKKLTEAVQKVVQQRGYIIGLDGRKIRIRSEHSALNFLLQSCGAIIMKKAMVILHQDLQELGLVEGVDYKQIAWIHDAFDFEVKTEYAEKVGQVIVDSIRKAGEFYNMRCPMDGAYHVGKDWSEVH